MEKMKIISISEMTDSDRKRYEQYINRLNKKIYRYHTYRKMREYMIILCGGVAGIIFLFSLVWASWAISLFFERQ